MNLKVSQTNSLRVRHPNLAAAWHPTRNPPKWTPDTLLPSSRALVWFICPHGPDHEWRVPVSKAVLPGGLDCPCCGERKVSVTNNLHSVRPDIAALWHPTLNGAGKNPETVLARGGGSVWLKNVDVDEWEVALIDVVDVEGLPPPPPRVPLGEVVEALEDVLEDLENREAAERRRREAAEAARTEQQRRQIEAEEEAALGPQKNGGWKRRFSDKVLSLVPKWGRSRGGEGAQ